MTCLPAAPSGTSRSMLSTRAATTVFAASAMTFLASSAAPTPLYQHYQAAFSLSPTTMTLIFASYAISLLLALLTVGSLSDYIGRRLVVVSALALNAVAMIAFMHADSATTLALARVLQGFATGTATTALGAAIMDNDRTRGPVLNSITAFVGLSAGALGSGLLVTYAPSPTRLIYAVLLLTSLAEAGLVWLTTETVRGKSGALASLVPSLHLPAPARKRFVQVTPVNIAGWALGGFNFSLMPALVRLVSGASSPLVGAVVVTNLMVAAALTVFLMRRQRADLALVAGAAALALGMATTLLAVQLHTVALMLAGTAIAGAGFGASFSGSVRTLLPLASSAERAGLLSVFYIESYLAFSLPVILVGILTRAVGLGVATPIYGTAIVLLSLTSLLALRAPVLNTPSAN